MGSSAEAILHQDDFRPRWQWHACDAPQPLLLAAGQTQRTLVCNRSDFAANAAPRRLLSTTPHQFDRHGAGAVRWAMFCGVDFRNGLERWLPVPTRTQTIVHFAAVGDVFPAMRMFPSVRTLSIRSFIRLSSATVFGSAAEGTDEHGDALLADLKGNLLQRLRLAVKRKSFSVSSRLMLPVKRLLAEAWWPGHSR